jgi:signal transduction histidine kinase
LAKEYLDLSKRPTALRALINEQKEKIELAPFISQVLVAENWYRGRNYEAALKAIQDMVDEFNAVPLDNDKVMQLKQNVLNRGATKVNQTL